MWKRRPSTVRELCTILFLHTCDYLYWLSRRIRGASPPPTSLRTIGVSFLGRLSEDSAVRLATLINDRCESLVEREHGTDFRVWGLHQDEAVQDLLREEFYGLALSTFEPRWRMANLMGNQVPNEPNSLGSGDGWHRDSNSPQFKIMILLSDVTNEADGAFAYIPKSHRLWSVIRTFNRHGRWRGLNTRWSESEMASLQSSVSLLTGTTGDIFAFNGALLHRGSPNRGTRVRVALTCYLFPKGKAPPHLSTNVPAS